MEEHKKRYNLIKEQLDNILKKEEIKYDGNIISAYELRDIINIELNDAYNIFYNTIKERDNINKKYKRFINKFSRNSINGNLNYIGYKTILDYKDRNNVQVLTFGFLKNNIIHKITIAKENENEECFTNVFYSDNSFTRKDLLFFKTNIEFITNTLNTMIYYNENYGIEFFNGGIYTHNLTQDFNYGIFKIKFNFSGAPFFYNAPTTYDSALKKETIKISPLSPELTQPFYTLWLTNECLEDYTIKNLDELSKRIPIEIKELNPLYKKIVDKSLEKYKVKQLKK